MAINLKVVNIDKQDKDYNRNIHQRYPDVKLFIQVGNDSIKTKNEDELLAHLLERYEWLIDQVMFDESLKDVRVLPQLHTYLRSEEHTSELQSRGHLVCRLL